MLHEEAEDQDDFIVDDDASEDDDGPIKYHIETYPADYTVTGLISLFDQGKIVIPEFQREYVWKKATASRLIESILMGIPIPNIFMYKEKNSKDWLVVDGQQRLFSLIYFYKGSFKGEKKTFELTGLDNKEWEGKSYESLSELDRDKLDNSVMRTLIVNQQNPSDNTSIYHVFKRLNSGGVKLTNQEVRNCIYYGEFNNLLKTLNEYPSWRSILGQRRVNNRQKDIEILARFLALHFWTYKSPMNEFLNNFYADNRHLKNISKNEIENVFYNTVDICSDMLEVKPFHSINGRFNIAFFESVFHTISANIVDISKLNLDGFEKLKADPQFLELIRATTTGEANVNERFKIAENYLTE